MLKKISLASLLMAMLVVPMIVTTSTNAQRRKARRRAPTSQAVTVLDNEAKLVKTKPKGVTVTDNEARLARSKGGARTARHTPKRPVSAAIDNSVSDGPVRVKAKKPGFMTGSGDGQSIRQKQPHGRRGRH